MVWVSRALFNSRFWVLALPKSGVVVVLSSNISIGVKVVLDLFFFGGGVGFAADQIMSGFGMLAT